MGGRLTKWALIAAFLPKPSMIVVFSVVSRARLARPNISNVTFSNLIPKSSETVHELHNNHQLMGFTQ